MPRDGNVYIFQAIDELPSIEEFIFDLSDLLPIVILWDAFPPAETATGLGDGPHHTCSILPCPEIGVYLRRKLESIEMAADESISVELLIPREEFSVDCESSVIIVHSEEYSYIFDQSINSMQSTQEKGGKSLKIKVGIFFGYNGEKFLGLQYQRDTENTIENIIHKILCEHGFILKTNMDNLRRIKWSRAGRTDKKVHALCNGISASLEFDERYIIDREKKVIDFEKATKDINAELPFDIRIFTIKKLGKAFDMRHDACSRVYNYIAPLKLFLSQEDFKAQKVLNEMQRDQLVAKLNHLVTLYLGTHNFHNFTKGYKTNDPRCDRFIISMRAELVQEQVINKYLEERFTDQEERKGHRMTFIRFTLVGQSFIYHQIRKMIGLLIKICYEQLPGEDTIKHAFTKQRYDVYLAPGEGLYLNRMTFQLYNKKKEPELRVELNEQEEDRIKRYRDYLESKILSHEINDKTFTNWLQDHDKHLKEDESQEEKSINND